MGFLTPKSKAVYEFIREYINENGYAPSYEEIMAHFGFRSVATVHKYIQRLMREGFIRRVKGKHRGIELMTPVTRGHETGQSVDIDDLVYLPLMGRIAAGMPVEKNLDSEFVPVPRFIVGQRKAYVLQVMGDSMIEDHILDGDLIIVEDRQTARPGEIVVAEVDGEVTLKRLKIQNNSAILMPSNPNYAPIVVPLEAVKIHGIVIGLFRRF